MHSSFHNIIISILFLTYLSIGQTIKPPTVSATEDFNGYVIITTNNIVDASTELSNLVEQKTEEGYLVSIVTDEHWGAQTANDRAENIRNWLKSHWEDDRIRYVLLIGNPDPFTGDVPMKLVYYDITVETFLDRQIPTDFYYSELSGDWDINGDGYYGDVHTDYGVSGGADHYGEVSVGRIPYYGVIEDLDHILRKSIDYRNASVKAWRKKALMVMTPTNEGNQSFPLGEAIKDSILIPGEWDYFRIYEPYNRYSDSTLQELYELSPAVELLGTTEQNVEQVWAENHFGYLIWWSHGTSTKSVGSIFRSSRAKALNDSFPTMVYQVSCNSAFPEDTNNLAYALLKQGAITVAGPTRETNSYRGQKSFLNSPSNSGMGYTYTKHVIEDGMSVGDALLTVRSNTTKNSWWPNILTYGIYGCPDLKLETVETTVARHATAVRNISGANRFFFDPRTREFIGNLESFSDQCKASLRVSDLAGRIIFTSNNVNMIQGNIRIAIPYEKSNSQQTVIVSVSTGGRTISNSVVIR